MFQPTLLDDHLCPLGGHSRLSTQDVSVYCDKLSPISVISVARCTPAPPKKRSEVKTTRETRGASGEPGALVARAGQRPGPGVRHRTESGLGGEMGDVIWARDRAGHRVMFPPLNV